jgi:hypothetical protein
VPTDDGSLVSTRDGRADAVVAITDPDFQKRLPSFVGAAVGVIEPKPEVAVALIDLQLGLPWWVDQQAGDLVSTGTSDVLSGALPKPVTFVTLVNVNVETVPLCKGSLCLFIPTRPLFFDRFAGSVLLTQRCYSTSSVTSGFCPFFGC